MRNDPRGRIEYQILRDELTRAEGVHVLDRLYGISLHTLQADDHEQSRSICSELQATHENTRTTSEERMTMLVRMLLTRVHQLDQVHSCAICMSKPRCSVMMPCAHLVTCDECACEVCPICCSHVETTLFVFPS